MKVIQDFFTSVNPVAESTEYKHAEYIYMYIESVTSILVLCLEKGVSVCDR